jgi:hypothetical protein
VLVFVQPTKDRPLPPMVTHRYGRIASAQRTSWEGRGFGGRAPRRCYGATTTREGPER